MNSGFQFVEAMNSSLSMIILLVSLISLRKYEREADVQESRFIFQQYMLFSIFYIILNCRDIALYFQPREYQNWIRVISSFGSLLVSLSIARSVRATSSEGILWEGIRKVRSLKLEKLTYQSIFDSFFDCQEIGISIVDTDGLILDINQSFANILEYERKELMGLNFRDFTFPEDRNFSHSKFGELLRGEVDSYVVHKRYFTKNGKIVWVRISVVWFYDETKEKKTIMAIAEDVTVGKDMELRLRQQLNDLEAIQHATSHQIRSSLGSMAKKMNRLKKNASKYTTEEIVSIAEESIQKALEIESILNSLPRQVLKKGGYQGEICNLHDAIEMAWQRLVDSTHSRPGVKIEKKDTNTQIHIELMTLANILQILIDNAIKYTPKSREPRIRIHLQGTDAYWLIRIQDNACGIPKNSMESIFHGFKRLHKNVEGDGMGLSLARKILFPFDGELFVEKSKMEKGSTFLIKIPRREVLL